jgi:hypothetical protein
MAKSAKELFWRRSLLRAEGTEVHGHLSRYVRRTRLIPGRRLNRLHATTAISRTSRRFDHSNPHIVRR